jgi:ankyrin repeat protein
METRRVPTDNEIKDMFKKFYDAAKTDPQYMPLDEKDTPRANLFKALIKAKDEEEKTIQAVKELITEVKKQGGDLNYYSDNGHTPVSIACLNNNPAILRLLIAEKADPHFTHCNISPVSLLRFAPMPNLMRATQGRSIKCIKILLDEGASPNEADESLQEAPIHIAAKDGLIEEMKLLLEAKAIVNSDKKYDSVPLELAVENEKAGAVNLLIDAKADVNRKNSLDGSPLHFAASAGNIYIIQSLLAAKADINAEDYKRETPLVLAIYGYYKTRSANHIRAIEHLISLDAEPTLTSNPMTTDIVSTKSIFAELRKKTRKWSCPQELENSLVACEINKGAPQISFKLCMLISEYIQPDFVNQDILAEDRFQRRKNFYENIPTLSVMIGIMNAVTVLLIGTFGTEQQRAQIINGSSLGYASLKTGLLSSVSVFALGKVIEIADEYKMVDKVKKLFKRA